jgi:hypothetical protein
VLHEIFHLLGAVPDCDASPVQRNGVHIDNLDDLMSSVSIFARRAQEIDARRNSYFRHGNVDCIDTARSPYLYDPARTQPAPRPVAQPRIAFNSTAPAPHHVRVVYALPRDGNDRQLDTSGVLSESLLRMNQWMAERADQRRIKMVERQGRPEVLFARLPMTRQQFSPETDVMGAYAIISDALGLRRPERKDEHFLVFYDGGTGVHTCEIFFNPPNPLWNHTIRLLRGAGSTLACDVDSNFSTDRAGQLELYNLRTLLQALGGAAQCAPHFAAGGKVTDDPRDILFDSVRWPRPRTLDAQRDDYFNHGRPDCPDLARSPFLTAR